MQKPYLEAGKIVNTHGVRGEVRIQPWADDAAFLLGFRTFYIDGAPVHVAHSRVHKGMLVAKFADYDDVNAAMTLKNRVVSIARADVTLPDGQYFQQDLIGIAVETMRASRSARCARFSTCRAAASTSCRVRVRCSSPTGRSSCAASTRLPGAWSCT